MTGVQTCALPIFCFGGRGNGCGDEKAGDNHHELTSPGQIVCCQCELPGAEWASRFLSCDQATSRRVAPYHAIDFVNGGLIDHANSSGPEGGKSEDKMKVDAQIENDLGDCSAESAVEKYLFRHGVSGLQFIHSKTGIPIENK